MRSRRDAGVVVALLLAASAAGCGASEPTGPSPPSPPPASSTRILVVTHTEGFRHDSIPAAETAIREIGLESGLFSTDYCRNADDVRRLLTAESLAPYRGVVFANTTGSLPIPDLPAFLSWIAAGRGFIGIHSASDTYHDQQSYLTMLGGEFVTHGAIVDAEVNVDDPSHPSVSHLAPSFRIADEFYRFKFVDGNRRVLMSLVRDPRDGGPAPVGAGQPLGWHKDFSSGKVFYTALGHRAELWQDVRYRRHILEGIRWALGG